MTARFRILVGVFSIVFLLVHLWSLPRALGDPDSINFAMAVESFDVAKHQPHPPGYPVYVALAKISTTVVKAVTPAWDRDRHAAVGLAVLSTIAGTLAAFALIRFWMVIGLPERLAGFAAFLAVLSPLFWITSVRPLTDVVGLVAAIAVQTGLLAGLRQIREGATSFPRVWLFAAIGVGLAPGIRSQAVWLAGPLACWAFGELIWRRRSSQAGMFAALVLAGGLAWFLPLIAMSGGLSGYVTMLRAQGAEDFVGVEMLATRPTLDMLRFALDRTFLVPWQVPILGQIVLALAIVGAVRLARQSRGAFASLCLAFLPYVVFHFTFQETLYVRYALPIVVPIAGFAVLGAAGLARQFAPLVAGALGVACLWIATPDARAYAAQISPLSAMARDMIEARRTSPEPAALTFHHPLWWSTRRTFDWYRSSWNVGPQPFPGDREWLRIVEHFRPGGSGRMWFLADPGRSDLSLIDWRAQTVRGRYERAAGLQRLVGGDLLERALWIEIRRPAWMLGRGWALTPEVGGATAQDARQPNRQPAEGWLERDGSPRRMMIGGRYLGGDGPASLVVSIDGKEMARTVVPPSPHWWVRWFDVPAGALLGDGAYAALSVSVDAATAGGAKPDLGLEQFDFTATDAFTYALGQGWQELEHNPGTGLSWRWSSERNAITVFGGQSDVELRLAGESPLRYFDGAPTVRVLAGSNEVGRFEPAEDFSEVVRIPARLLAERPTTITIESSRFWVPAERSNSLDRRHLGLRLYELRLREMP